jgi:hypothetical protein
VCKGEKGRHIEYWEFLMANPKEGDEEKRRYPIHEIFTILSAAQVDGIPPLELSERNEMELSPPYRTLRSRNASRKRIHDIRSKSAKKPGRFGPAKRERKFSQKLAKNGAR